MNEEQRRYLAHIGESDTEEILIKRTGWEAINLPTHTHEKFQIIYTLSRTLHIKIGSNTYSGLDSESYQTQSIQQQPTGFIDYFLHQSAYRKRTRPQSAVLHLGGSSPDR